MGKRTGAFRDEECTCYCGNKHEFYGGIGYIKLNSDGYSDGKVNGGYYIHKVQCKACKEISELVLN